MLYIIHLEDTDGDFTVTKLVNKELVAKYIRNNRLMKSDYVLLEGEVLESFDRHIFDGRFQTKF